MGKHFPLSDYDPAIRIVRTVPGTASKIGAAVGKDRTTVCRWKRVPAEFVHVVEALTGVPRHLIRPDLYPKNRERLR